MCWGLTETLDSSGTPGLFGRISKDTVWNNEVYVVGDIIVERGATLTLSPGTIVTFAPSSSVNDYVLTRDAHTGYCDIIIHGKLVIGDVGDEKGELVRIGNPDLKGALPGPGWGTIAIAPGARGCSITNAKIHFALIGISLANSAHNSIRKAEICSCNTGIMIHEASRTRIENLRIYETKTGIVANERASVIMKMCIITRNTENIMCGGTATINLENNLISKGNTGIMCAVESKVEISHNTILANARGIWCLNRSEANISSNKISENQIGIALDGRPRVFIGDNKFARNTKKVVKENEM
jgi:parallel beta-helix repeat protein